MRRSLLALAAALGLLVPAAGWAKPPVWIVRDKDSRIVLFGSVHLLPGGLDWEPQRLKQAIAGADDLWFEIPLDDHAAGEVAQLALQKGLAPPNQKLSALLSANGRERLARVCAKLGVPPARLEGLQPWYAELILAAAVWDGAGAAGAQGVEQRLNAEAPPGLVRKALETPAQQIDYLAGGRIADQVASLEDSLREIEEEPDQFKQLLAAWLAGDTKALDAEALAPIRRAAPAIYDILIRERNRRWVEAIARRMAGKGRTVIVVGAGHLVGPDGLPTLLRARGFKVEGP